MIATPIGTSDSCRSEKPLPHERKQAHLEAVRRTRKEINLGLRELYEMLLETKSIVSDQIPDDMALDLPVLPTTKRPSNLLVIQKAAERISLLRKKTEALVKDVSELQRRPSHITTRPKGIALRRIKSTETPSKSNFI
eukprot:CFRG1224T1